MNAQKISGILDGPLEKYEEYLYLAGGNGIQNRTLIFKFPNSTGLIFSVKHVYNTNKFASTAKHIYFSNDYVWDEFAVNPYEGHIYRTYYDMGNAIESALIKDKQYEVKGN